MSELLVKIAKQRFDNPSSQIVHFADNDEANEMLNNLNEYPHDYALACLMDRQIKAEKTWIIPFEIHKEFGSFNINFS